MRGGIWALVALVLTLLCSPIVQAQADPVATLAGMEGSACEAPKITCWEVTDGDLAGNLVAGSEVTVLVQAVGEAPHNLYVTTPDQADPNRLNTDGSAAFANSDTVSSGEETTFTFEVPTDAEELYFWCDVLEHEAGGMWFILPVLPAEEGQGNGTMAGGNETTEEEGSDEANASQESEEPQEEEQAGDEEDESAEAGMSSEAGAEEDGTPGPGALSALAVLACGAWLAARRS
ncbi:MAG: hypothetical protein R3185_03275 [Candidatus Thermoplasmatota archaeon]|nr:hypothetical protein [Candidatus Thermoplasmatota archaeon]